MRAEDASLLRVAKMELGALQDAIDWPDVKPVFKSTAARWAKRLGKASDSQDVWRLATELADIIKPTNMLPRWHESAHDAQHPAAVLWVRETDANDEYSVLRAVRMLRAHVVRLEGGPMYSVDGETLLEAGHTRRADTQPPPGSVRPSASQPAPSLDRPSAHRPLAHGSAPAALSEQAPPTTQRPSAPAAPPKEVSTQKLAAASNPSWSLCGTDGCILERFHKGLCILEAATEDAPARKRAVVESAIAVAHANAANAANAAAAASRDRAATATASAATHREKPKPPTARAPAVKPAASSQPPPTSPSMSLSFPTGRPMKTTPLP